MSVQLPEYLSVGDDERGQPLGIDWDSYRRLASTALAIIGQNRPTMGLYKKNGLAALDIFNRRNWEARNWRKLLRLAEKHFV
jgi:hypothetical protein